MSRVARSVAELTASSLLRPGVTEHDLGVGFAEAAKHLVPLFGKQLEFVFKQQLLELVRSEMVSHAEREAGRLPGAETVNVSFADLVGFTRMGEEVPPEELGAVADRLVVRAAELVESPVRVVKTIGDAVMLVSPEAYNLVDVVLRIVQAIDDEGADFPQVHVGIARGDALNRGGDWFGRPVNLASRVTAIARAGSVLATREVRDETREDFRWSSAGARRLKGLPDPVPLYRARRLTA
jgi:adenylate cyclase